MLVEHDKNMVSKCYIQWITMAGHQPMPYKIADKEE